MFYRGNTRWYKNESNNSNDITAADGNVDADEEEDNGNDDADDSGEMIIMNSARPTCQSED